MSENEKNGKNRKKERSCKIVEMKKKKDSISKKRSPSEKDGEVVCMCVRFR